MSEYPYPQEQTQVRAYRDRVSAEYKAVGRFLDPADLDCLVWFTRYGYSCRAMPEPQAADKHIAELHLALHQSPVPGPTPMPEPGTPTNRPLVGPLRVQDKMMRDDSGWRRVFFCSWFPALRILRDDAAAFYRQLDAIAAANYQGIRIFLAVGGWMDYWDGREVAPVTFQKWYWTGNHLRTDTYGETIQAWPDYDDLLRTLIRACRARQLRLHVTTGDMQMICPESAREIQLHERFARICADEGGTEAIAVAEATNEFPLNRYGGDSPTSIEQMGRVLNVWKQAIPGVLTMQGAIPQNEEPESLVKASTNGDLCAVHVTRQPGDKCIKRTFGLVYGEGNYRWFPKPFWQGEPCGPGEDSFDKQDDPNVLVAAYAMHALTGQPSVRFQGAAVRFKQTLDSEWGFAELPALFDRFLPEDVAQWPHSSDRQGGVEYWFKGKAFRSVIHKDWNPSPPISIDSWTCYPSGQSGQGIPPRGLTGLLVGEFAS